MLPRVYLKIYLLVEAAIDVLNQFNVGQYALQAFQVQDNSKNLCMYSITMLLYRMRPVLHILPILHIIKLRHGEGKLFTQVTWLVNARASNH